MIKLATDNGERVSDPHGSGKAYCLCCKHEWIAVAPIGVTRFECPHCHSEKGIWKYEFIPETMRQCKCGNQLFYITPQGHMCPNCGIFQEY